MQDPYAKRNAYKGDSYVHAGTSLLANDSYVHAGSSLPVSGQPMSRQDKAMRTRLNHAFKDVNKAEHENQLITSSLVHFREQTMTSEIKELEKALKKAQKKIAKYEDREDDYENHIEVLERKLEDANKLAFSYKDKVRRLEEERRREKYVAFRLKQEERPYTIVGPGGSYSVESPQQIHSGKYKRRDKELDRLVLEEAIRRAPR